jgi:ATP-binding cassette subfamily B protein
MTPPPGGQMGAGPMGRWNFGAPKAKPRDMRGTLVRLWALTNGARGGLGWILALSAFASASAIFSPKIIGDAIDRIDKGNYAAWIIAMLLSLYVSDWLVRFLQQFFQCGIILRPFFNVELRRDFIGCQRERDVIQYDLFHRALLSVVPVFP